jgi:hypothetical protein
LQVFILKTSPSVGDSISRPCCSFCLNFFPTVFKSNPCITSFIVFQTRSCELDNCYPITLLRIYK